MRWFTEGDVARLLGVSRLEFKKLRGQLEEGDVMREGRQVRILESGLERLRATIRRLRAVEVEKMGLEKNDAPAGLVREEGAVYGDSTTRHVSGVLAEVLEDVEQKIARRVEALRVKRTVQNPRIVMAVDSGGREVRVRVRDSKNFTPGMVLRGALVQGDLFDLVGRCPRFRGRW